MTLPALADSIPPPPAREAPLPGHFACALAPGCRFSGTWLEYLHHAPLHPLPHPHNRAAWLDSRRTFIGASELAACVGANPYQGPLEVWAAKVSPRPEPTFTRRPLDGGGWLVSPSTATGSMLEKPLLDDFAQRHGCRYVQPATARHPSLPWAAATPDADVDGGPLVQVKVVGWRVAPDWEEGVPFYTVLQVQDEMEVWGRDRVIVLALVGSELREYEVRRDPELVGPALEIAGELWRYVERCEVPLDFDLRNTNPETLLHLWPQPTEPAIPASPEFVAVARAYAEARDREKVGREDKEAFAVQIQAMLGAHAGATWGRSRVLWRSQAARIDWRAYALSLGGSDDGAEKFRPLPTRTLDVRLKGE